MPKTKLLSALVLLTAFNLVYAQSNAVTSKAYHYKSLGKMSVDQRTGGLSYSYSMGGVQADFKRPPKFSLSLLYNSLDTNDDFNLGQGWGFNLTRYDKQTRYKLLDPPSYGR